MSLFRETMVNEVLVILLILFSFFAICILMTEFNSVLRMVIFVPILPHFYAYKTTVPQTVNTQNPFIFTYCAKMSNRIPSRTSCIICILLEKDK